jgi:protein tyrosine phosphatase (PTP) superfamily phosphohydrolase (DUF442 family)
LYPSVPCAWWSWYTTQHARQGYSVVINLLPDSHQFALAGEAEITREHALGYHHIPVDFAAPTQESYSAFERTLDAVDAQQRVYVHCAANMRVSAFLAIYGIKRWGWSVERAERLIAEVWEPNEAWSAFIGAHVAWAR